MDEKLGLVFLCLFAVLEMVTANCYLVEVKSARNVVLNGAYKKALDSCNGRSAYVPFDKTGDREAHIYFRNDTTSWIVDTSPCEAERPVPLAVIASNALYADEITGVWQEIPSQSSNSYESSSLEIVCYDFGKSDTTTPTTKDPNDDDGGGIGSLPVWVITVIIMVVFVLAVGIPTAMLFWSKRRKRRQQQASSASTNQGVANAAKVEA